MPMIAPAPFARFSDMAVAPEQVLSYVCAVAGSTPRVIGSCLCYVKDGGLVLVGYPVHDPLDAAAMARAVDEALITPGIQRITVIGPTRPPQAPERCAAAQDCYYALPVPPAPGQKLRNLLRRAGRELTVERGRSCGEDHLALVQRYIDERTLAAGTRHIFRQLPAYLAASAGSLLISARRADGRLAAFAVGEFAARRTAFFMFCFRQPELSPPGAADLLLSGLLDEARERGQTRMNLGIGVNAGIRFFKRKWGAEPFLPYLEASWELRAPGLLERLLGIITR
jgi:hypothetical protein